MNVDQLKAQIDAGLGKIASSTDPKEFDLASIKSGKLYEARVLLRLLEDLVKYEGFQVKLVNGNLIRLKTGHGPINRQYPHFQLVRNGTVALEVWTDIYFSTLSWSRRGRPTPLTPGDFHELDIVVVPYQTGGLPRHDEIVIGVECKDTAYAKRLLREVLGVRRELSFFQEGFAETGFQSWPAKAVRANPASCLLVYSTDPDVKNFEKPGEIFGIWFFHEPL